jgi:hypothetical protein
MVLALVMTPVTASILTTGDGMMKLMKAFADVARTLK